MVWNIKIFAKIAPVILFITFTAQEPDAAFLKSFDAINGDCAKQFNFTLDYVMNQIWTLQQFPTDNNLKCFFSCVALKVGSMDETGDIKEDVIEKVCGEFFSLTLADKMGDTCDVAKDGDLCQTAYDMMQCILDLKNGKPK